MPRFCGKVQFAVARSGHSVEMHITRGAFDVVLVLLALFGLCAGGFLDQGLGLEDLLAPGAATIMTREDGSVGAECEAVVRIAEPDIEQRLFLLRREVLARPGFTAVFSAEDHLVVPDGPAQLRVEKENTREVGARWHL